MNEASDTDDSAIRFGMPIKLIHQDSHFSLPIQFKSCKRVSLKNIGFMWNYFELNDDAD